MINEDTLITDALAKHPDIAGVLQANGLHCFGCPSNHGKTLSYAAETHGANIQDMLAEMNRLLNE